MIRNTQVLAGIIIIFCTLSCNQPEPGKTTEAPVTEDSSVTPDIPPPQPFTLQDAESLIGKYYNQQNQLAKYAFYKSVTTKNILIDSSYHRDTILVTADSYGRTWNNPNKDTITTPFSQQVVLKVYRYQQIWWADKLLSPDAVNAIQEPVKK